MKRGAAPRLEPRRAADFERALLARARAWIPSWSLDDNAPDFGQALLKIAARFSSEVAERLDGAGDKMSLGFLDWLGLRAEAARPARMPVVLRLAETARAAVFAPHPVKMQVDVAGATVTFETETDLTVLPGRLDAVVAVDPAEDTYFLPPPGLTGLDALEPLPTAWQLKNFAAEGSATLQLDPGLGLAAEMIVEIAGGQYRIVTAKDDLVTIDPPVPAGGFDIPTRVTKVESFHPFDEGLRNRQQHILYIGDPDTLNIDAEARIEVGGLAGLPEAEWEYWGKAAEADAADAQPRWRKLERDKDKADELILIKPKGAVEPTEVGGTKGRWIRARLERSGEVVETDEIRLRINPREKLNEPPEALKKPQLTELPPLDAFVNATPSPTSDFFPLGRQPRLFDTLYLGSAEAFSKPAATAWIQFDLGDPSFSALSAIGEPGSAHFVVAGVGADGALHLMRFDPQSGRLAKFRDREPLKPPLPRIDGEDGAGAKVALDGNLAWRLPIWAEGQIVCAAATAGAPRSDVWIWKEMEQREGSGWIFAGTVPSEAGDSAPIDGLVHLAGPDRLFAVRGGVLYARDTTSAGTWQRQPPAPGGEVPLQAIVPVRSGSGMIGISRGLNPQLYQVAANGTRTLVGAGISVSPAVPPAAALDANGDLLVVAASPDQLNLVAHDDAGGAPPPLDLEGQVNGAIDLVFDGQDYHFLAATNEPGTQGLAAWTPRSADPVLFKSYQPTGLNRPAGGPVALPGHVLLPGEEAEIFIVELDLSKRVVAKVPILAGVVIPTSAGTTLLPGDTVALVSSATSVPQTVSGFGTARDTETFYPISGPFGANLGAPLVAFATSGLPQQGAFTAGVLDEFTLQPGDQQAVRGSWLRLDGVLYQVTSVVDPAVNPRTVKIAPSLPNTAGAGQYFNQRLTGGRAVSAFALDPTPDDKWTADLLDRIALEFPGATPDSQRGKAFRTDTANRPLLVVLAEEFSAAAANQTFILNAAAGEWEGSAGSTSKNPELAWEYWNGAGWWQLAIEADGTQNLKKSGAVRFTIPRDAAATDWAGKINHWVRARLIGGDYGEEKVVVHTQTSGNKSEQTIERTSEGIQPPYALDVRTAYALDNPVTPRFVITEDSGTRRDQSDANRTPGAEIEIFTPLAVALERLDAPASAQNGAAACIADCQCPGGVSSESPAPPSGTGPAESSAPSARAAGRRALYLGFSKKPVGAQVNLLAVAAREGGYDRIAPLAVDALIGGRFRPVVVNDETRGLGETGLVKLALDGEPIQAELFGKALFWLRLTPAGGDAGWAPSLAGLYPNAVWARAAETMTRELLGSSQGQPLLMLNVARPPLLRDSLELRVREPLGEEEREALENEDPESIRREVPDLPGDWVLWKQVPDPVDCGPADRVYALDEATGAIRFGDGRHGMIPPVGVDSIVAFAYRRTDPPGTGGKLAANFVTARTELNLVTPVESVEAAVAADRSAGGVAPETAPRVLEFAPATLRHRGRAVSALDFEEIVRQKSADVVQSRCIPSNRRVRLVVAMRGADPAPGEAQKRELRRMLLEVAPPALGASGALTIDGPKVRRLRVELVLRVRSFDVAGSLATEAKKRLVARFDTAQGEGWPLGSSPREDDIAEALLDIPGLDGLDSVRLKEVDALGAERPWPASLGRDELAMLAPAGIAVDFAGTEAVA